MSGKVLDSADTGKYPLIENPFVKMDSFVKPRLSLAKDPINKVGNTDYLQYYQEENGIQINNELDPKLNYFISDKLKEKEPSQMEIPLDEDFLDYDVSAEQLNKCRTDGKEPHKDPLPISFLNIKTEEEGLLWYKKHYPKIPDDLLPIIARYHWGDAINKHTIKKEKKKNKKKEVPHMTIKHAEPNNPIIVKFD
tara:strand:+ start:57 stop:638 length:582 start_codon:yes stop_codon:yes gene_type:complete